MGSKIKIYRDANGVLINIGEWDYGYQEQTVMKTNCSAVHTPEVIASYLAPKELS